MITRKLISLGILSMLVLVFTLDISFAKVQTSEQSVAPTTQQEKRITVRGKIAFMKNLGGYYVNGEDPPGEYMIVNMNKRALKKLMKSGKTVTIEGHLTMGADHLFIEKIDGRKYSGAK